MMVWYAVGHKITGQCF